MTLTSTVSVLPSSPHGQPECTVRGCPSPLAGLAVMPWRRLGRPRPVQSPGSTRPRWRWTLVQIVERLAKRGDPSTAQGHGRQPVTIGLQIRATPSSGDRTPPSRPGPEPTACRWSPRAPAASGASMTSSTLGHLALAQLAESEAREHWALVRSARVSRGGRGRHTPGSSFARAGITGTPWWPRRRGATGCRACATTVPDPIPRDLRALQPPWAPKVSTGLARVVP